MYDKITSVANSVGTDPSHISRIFNGKSRPSLPLAIKIANYLGISVEQLCRDLGIGSTGDLKP